MDFMNFKFKTEPRTVTCFGMWFLEFLSDNPQEATVEEEEIELLTVSI